MKITEDNMYKEWLNFYRSEFKNLSDFQRFAEKCLIQESKKSLRILNAGMRLISFADNSHKLANKERPSLQILFLVLSAEACWRLKHDKKYDAKVSKKSVSEFCEEYFTNEDKELLKSKIRFFSTDDNPELIGQPSFKKVIEYFYRIRCQVIHQGEYWHFFWADENADMVSLDTYMDKEKLISALVDVREGTSYKHIRPIFLRAIINCAQSPYSSYRT